MVETRDVGVGCMVQESRVCCAEGHDAAQPCDDDHGDPVDEEGLVGLSRAATTVR